MASPRLSGRSNEIDMLHGPLLGKILLFALPLAASSILQQLFNSADIAVVGQFAGKNALAAVGSNSAFTGMFINLITGLAVGANVLAARYIGLQEPGEIRRTVHTVTLLSLFVGIGFTVVGLVISDTILRLTHTPDEIFAEALLYLRLYFAGMIFIVFYNFGAAILRSKGDTRRPLMVLIATGILNVLLNVFFVVAFGMGVAGVALATLIANAVSAAVILYFLLKEPEPFRLNLKMLAVHGDLLIQILRIGIPAGIQSMVFSLANVYIQSVINSFGSATMAGSAGAFNYEAFTYYMCIAFAQAAVTFVSQNHAAGDFTRCRRVMWLSMLCSYVFCGLMCAVFVWKAQFFCGIYTSDPEALQAALVRLLRVGSLELLVTTYEIPAGGLRGIGYSVLPAIVTILGSCAFRFFWVLMIFPLSPTFIMLLAVYPVTWVITGTAMLISWFILSRRAFRTTA